MLSILDNDTLNCDVCTCQITSYFFTCIACKRLTCGECDSLHTELEAKELCYPCAARQVGKTVCHYCGINADYAELLQCRDCNAPICKLCKETSDCFLK